MECPCYFSSLCSHICYIFKLKTITQDGSTSVSETTAVNRINAEVYEFTCVQ